jgi:catechol 2,3-dioxygenase-like lactoylglutathione lyase family enzyme
MPGSKLLSSYSQIIKNMNAKALNLSPMLETKDMQATLKFYTEVLGFKCDTFSEEWGWAHFSKDEVAIMFSKPNEERKHTRANYEWLLYIGSG